MCDSRQQQQSQQQHTVWRVIRITLREYAAKPAVSMSFAFAKKRCLPTIFSMLAGRLGLQGRSLARAVVLPSRNCRPLPRASRTRRLTLIEVHPGRPGGGKVLARLATYINGQARLFGKSVRRADRFKFPDVSEGLVEARSGKADGDDEFARSAARSPVAVLVVAADGFG